MTELKTKFQVGDRVYSKMGGDALLKIGTVKQLLLSDKEFISYDVDWDEKPNPNYQILSGNSLGHLSEILAIIGASLTKLASWRYPN